MWLMIITFVQLHKLNSLIDATSVWSSKIPRNTMDSYAIDDQHYPSPKEDALLGTYPERSRRAHFS